MPETFRVGLLGRGTVGSAFERLLGERAEEVAAVTGLRPEITGVLTRSRGAFDEVRAREDVVEVALGAREHAAQLGPGARDRGDGAGALGEQPREGGPHRAVAEQANAEGRDVTHRGR